MYQNYQSVIVDVFLVASFTLHVWFALKGIFNMTSSLNALLNKGVTDLLFRKIKKQIYTAMFLVLTISCLITWRLFELLSFLDVSGYGLYIFLTIFAVYSFTFLAAFIFCKFLLIASQRAGL